MKYVLLMCSDATVPDDVADEGYLAGCGGWSDEMALRGILKDSAGLRPASDATTIKVRGDDVLLSDGPFAETRDQIGGFVVIECADLDEAIDLASAHPWAKAGQIEVRPVWER